MLHASLKESTFQLYIFWGTMYSAFSIKNGGSSMYCPCVFWMKTRRTNFYSIEPQNHNRTQPRHPTQYLDCCTLVFEIEIQLNDIVLSRQFILLRTEPCQPLNHHWEQREDSNLYAPKRVLKKSKLVVRRHELNLCI